LALRCTIPVELHDDIAERLVPACETALYYTVAEALTNVVRYAGATSATVWLSSADGWAEAEIADDGGNQAPRSRAAGLAE
jgi:signal transduction histidine kinase